MTAPPTAIITPIIPAPAVGRAPDRLVELADEAAAELARELEDALETRAGAMEAVEEAAAAEMVVGGVAEEMEGEAEVEVTVTTAEADVEVAGSELQMVNIKRGSFCDT
jgi:hypothetical protein